MSNINEEHLSEINVWDYIDDPSAFAKYEEHLSTCSDCQSLISEAKLLVIDLKNIQTPEPSSQFTSQVIGRVKMRAVSFPWFVRVVAASFIFVIGLIINVLIQEGISFQAPNSFFYSLIMVIIVASMLMIESANRLKNLNGVWGGANQ